MTSGRKPQCGYWDIKTIALECAENQRPNGETIRNTRDRPLVEKSAYTG